MHSVNLGAIVGGAVGGFVVLTMITTIFHCVRRRTHKQQTAERGAQPSRLRLDICGWRNVQLASLITPYGGPTHYNDLNTLYPLPHIDAITK